MLKTIRRFEARRPSGSDYQRLRRRLRRYGVGFPESAFQPRRNRWTRYRLRMRKGYRRASASTIVICGCIRDAADVLDRNRQRIENTGKLFRDYRVVVFESDSSDTTLPKLRQWARENDRVTILSERLHHSRQEGHGDYRMRVMSYCRNRYLEFAHQAYLRFDFLIVIDLDSRGGWSNDGLAHTLSFRNWDMIGANGIQLYEPPGYYDSYPLREKHFDDLAYRGGRRNGSEVVEYVDWKEQRQPRLSRGDTLVPVKSCFGGMGIYRMAAMAGCRYGSDDCEHVTLHRTMHQRGHGRLFVNPSLIFIR